MMKTPRLRSTSHRMFSHRADPATLAEQLRARESATISALNSILRHPRSLARPVPTWRPPSKHLPQTGESSALTAAITRHRVGPRARARIRGFGETREPAYVVSVRLTEPRGRPVDPGAAEAWIRALVPADLIGTVHEITGSHPPTYCWLVDGNYLPVDSPASLFSGFELAA